MNAPMKTAGIKKLLCDLTKNEYLVLFIVLSAFVSVFFLAAMILVVIPIYMFVTRQAKLALPTKKYEYFLLLFAIVAFLTTVLHSQDTMFNGFLIKSLYLKLLGIGIIILCFDIYFFSNIMTKRAFLLGLKLSALLGILCFAVGIYQRVNKIYVSELRPGRHASLFMNENYYGTIIVFLALICLYLFFKTENNKAKIFYAFAFLCNVGGLWLCQSRAAFIVIAVSILVFFFAYNKKVAIILTLLLIGFTILLFRYPSILPRFEETSDYLHFRFGIWKVAGSAFLDAPLLGHGFYSYCSIWELYTTEPFFALHAHNLYIEILLNFGLIGTLFIGAYAMNITFRCIKNAVKLKKSPELALILGFVASILVNGCADITLFWPQTGFFAIYLLAIPKIYQTEEKSEDQE